LLLGGGGLIQTQFGVAIFQARDDLAPELAGAAVAPL